MTASSWGGDAMRLVLAAVIAVVLGTSAKAQVGVEEFRQLCMDHRGDRSATLVAADASGWMPVPQAMLEKFPAGVFKEPEARMRSTKEALLLLIVGHGNPGAVPGADLQICGVATMPAVPGGFEQGGADLSGVEKFGDASNAFFFWREEEGKHIRIDMSEVASAISTRKLNMLMTRQSEKMSMIVLAVSPSTDQPAAAPH